MSGRESSAPRLAGRRSLSRSFGAYGSFDSIVSNSTLRTFMRKRCDSLPKRRTTRPIALLAGHMSGFNHSYRGDFKGSRACFEEGLRNPACVMGALHPRVGSLGVLSHMLLYLGHLDQARARLEQALAEGRKSNPFSLAVALICGIMFFRTHGEFTPLTDELLSLADEQGFRPWWEFAAIARGWSLAMKGQPEVGIAQIVEVEKTKGQTSVLTYTSPVYLAEAYGSAGQPEEGLRRLEEAEKTPQMRAYVGGWAEIHLVRGRLLVSSGDLVAAETQLRQAHFRRTRARGEIPGIAPGDRACAIVGHPRQTGGGARSPCPGPWLVHRRPRDAGPHEGESAAGRTPIDRARATMRLALIPTMSVGVLLAAAAAAQGGGRVLTTSDVVAIRIVDHPDLDWTARVEPDGTINFPYVGRIKAAGLTEDDLARAVERRLLALKIIAEP